MNPSGLCDGVGGITPDTGGCGMTWEVVGVCGLADGGGGGCAGLS